MGRMTEDDQGGGGVIFGQISADVICERFLTLFTPVTWLRHRTNVTAFNVPARNHSASLSREDAMRKLGTCNLRLVCLSTDSLTSRYVNPHTS